MLKDTDNKIRQKKFLEEYANTLDIKASALAAGYKRQTAVANIRNLFKNPRFVSELKALCEKKAACLEICPGYIVLGYLKILDWALALDENGKPNDAALALRALDGVVKQTNCIVQPDLKTENNFSENHPIINNIKGLDPNKI